MAVLLGPWRRRHATIGALATLGLIYIVGQQSGPAGKQWPSAGCLQILRMSPSLLGTVDQYASSAPGACRSGSQDASQARSCLRRRAARLRRPARLVFVGDSRSRILQRQLQVFLQLRNTSEPVDVMAEQVPPGPLHNELLLTTRDLCKKLDKFCSRLVGNELLQVDFWRRPYVHSLFVQRLWTLVAECRAEPPNCPDLVVLNNGMWYLRFNKKLKFVESSPMQGTFLMRQHVSALRTVLAELVKEVTVVWRLEEAVTSDALILKRKEKFQKKLSLSHVFFYELQTQVPELKVWSSMLPETFDFAQRVCRPVKHVAESKDTVIEDIFDQCDDEIHVGPFLRQRFVSKLLDILCEVDGDREPGHCCRG